MEVKVDSDKIKSERARRAWSQDHLATVAGISLRTLQRIEKTGTASQESVRALASALSLAVADLQLANGASSSGVSVRLQWTWSLPLRVAMLFVAGLIPALYPKRMLDLGIAWDVLFTFVLPAACIVGAVVWSYRRFGTHLVPRAVAFTGVAGLVYFVANATLFYTPPPV